MKNSPQIGCKLENPSKRIQKGILELKLKVEVKDKNRN